MNGIDLYVFPAYAGMSPPMPSRRAPVLGFPRLRGDEPDEQAATLHTELFSPPTRG